MYALIDDTLRPSEGRLRHTTFHAACCAGKVMRQLKLENLSDYRYAKIARRLRRYFLKTWRQDLAYKEAQDGNRKG